jgi:SAM-dependent methyltransferase
VTQLLNTFYPETTFGGFSDVDGTLVFYARVRELTNAQATVLDVGCGRGAANEDPIRIRREIRTLRGYARRVIGIDVDPLASNNPLIDEFRLIEGSAWPLESCSVDTIVADWVLEHVADVRGFFSECQRVLRPGGFLALRTANVLSYVGLAARVVPNRWHNRALRAAGNGKRAEDVFATRYQCNTLWRLRRTLAEHGFRACVYGFDSEPHYLNFSSLAYRFGRFHQRHAPRALRAALFAFAERVAEAER